MAEINIPIKAEIQEFLDRLTIVEKKIEEISTSAKDVGETIITCLSRKAYSIILLVSTFTAPILLINKS